VKKRLTITDVTRMQEGRVCVAGYDQDGKCVRPVLPPPGIHERSLYFQGQPIVFPFAVVEYDFQKQVSEPPHTEDWRYDPASVRFIERLDETRKRTLLDQTLFPNVVEVFEAPIFSDVGHYVLTGQGTRSLGTLRPKHIIKAIYKRAENKWKYRLGFVDGSESKYWLTVTDLSWRYYNDALCLEGHSSDEIASALTRKLVSSQVFLRIGLARGWAQYPNCCFLQITGVYTFPDYLEGRMFADFKPKTS
jgi:hypothetical protein